MDTPRHEITKFKGINLDVEPMELMGIPVWTGGRNVYFDTQATQRVKGYGKFASPYPVTPIVPVFLHPLVSPINTFWLYVLDDAITCTLWVTDGVTHWDITPVGGLTVGGPGVWTATTLNGVPVLNNQKDYPMWWNGDPGTIAEVLPDWPVDQYCRAIRGFKFHLFALGLTRGGIPLPFMLAWSSGADAGTIPQEWTPLPSNDAGDVSLAEELGGIVDGLPLRDNFFIYRQHSTAYCSYVAGQFVFTFRELFNTSGVQGLNCVAEVRGHHYVITDDDIIKHDGNTFASIADDVLRESVFRSIRPENHFMCHVAARTSRDEIWFCFPSVDSTYLDFAAVYSVEEQVFGIRSLEEFAHVRTGIIPDQNFDRTWDGALTIWIEDPRRWNDANYSITNDGMLIADPTGGRLLEVGKQNDYDGVPIESFVERLYHTLGGEDEIWDNALIRSVWINATGTPGDELRVRIGGSVAPNAPIQWGPEIPYRMGTTDIPKIDSMVHGRFLSIRFASTGGDPWQLHRFGVDYVPLAKY